MAAAFALELLAVYVAPRMAGQNDLNIPDHAFGVFALPIVLIILMLGSALLSGMLSTIEEEEQREWWARAGGVFSIFVLTWIAALAVWRFGKIEQKWDSRQAVADADG